MSWHATVDLFEFFRADEDGGAAAAATPIVDPLDADLKDLGLSKITDEDINKAEAEARKAAGVSDPDKKPDEAKDRERGANGKFIAKSEPVGETGEGEDKGTENTDAEGEGGDATAEAQTKWDAQVAAEAEAAKANQPPAAFTEDKREVSPEQSKAEADQLVLEQAEKAKATSTGKIEFTPFELLTDEDIKNDQGEVFTDTKAVKDKYNQMAESSNKVIAAILEDNAQLKAKIGGFEQIIPAVTLLLQEKHESLRVQIGKDSEEASALIKAKYGLEIKSQDIRRDVEKAFMAFKQAGRIGEGKLPDAGTMADMWEFVNKPRLDSAGITPRAIQNATKADEPEEKETKKTVARLPEKGQAGSNGKAAPTSDDEAIKEDLERARKGQALRPQNF